MLWKQICILHTVHRIRIYKNICKWSSSKTNIIRSLKKIANLTNYSVCLSWICIIFFVLTDALSASSSIRSIGWFILFVRTSIFWFFNQSCNFVRTDTFFLTTKGPENYAPIKSLKSNYSL